MIEIVVLCNEEFLEADCFPSSTPLHFQITYPAARGADKHTYLKRGNRHSLPLRYHNDFLKHYHLQVG
jgi:hypothetical protein